MKPSRAQSGVAVAEADSVAEGTAVVVTAVAEARAVTDFDLCDDTVNKAAVDVRQAVTLALS